MVILTILKWLLLIILFIFIAVLILVAYFILAPFFYDFNGDFDNKSIKLSVKDPLKIINFELIKENKLTKVNLGLIFNLIKIKSDNKSNRNKKKKSPKNTKPKESAQDLEPKEESTKDPVETAKSEESESSKDKKNKKDILAELKDFNTKESLKTVNYIIKELFKTIGKLIPKRFFLEIDFSTGSPDTTGILTGAVALLPFIYRYKSKISPDFLSERAYINGFLELSGYFALVNLVIFTVKILCQKQVRKLLKTVL